MPSRKLSDTDNRLDRTHSPSLRNWEEPPEFAKEGMKSNAAVRVGWGRLIFGHTYPNAEELAVEIKREAEGQRDISLYLRDPHVVLSLAPDEFFMDPSHTYRLWLDDYQEGRPRHRGLIIRRVRTLKDIEEINRIYATHGMVRTNKEFVLKHRQSRTRTFLVAENTVNNRIVGSVTGIDHHYAFRDPENGSSLWCLAVDAQAQIPGIGEALVRFLAEHFITRGRTYMDLSVMHDNTQAIALYEKIGFQRVPVFCVKRKNSINEPLFTPPRPDEGLNPYAGIIVKEARRRGIHVEVQDAEEGFFTLSLGGRRITCRESLSELTHAVAMSRCDDKRVTRRILHKAGLKVPDQFTAGEEDENLEFLKSYKRIVVKPARGEQGQGISMDIQTPEELEQAVAVAREVCETVILEEMVAGQDLRIIVIGGQMVAAAVRVPPGITGTGKHAVRALIEKLSRRRHAATGGESGIPLDTETERCVRAAGYALDDILPVNETIRVRKTANLHTGGTIHDVTERIHPELKEAAERSAHALDIPVVGMDFLVSSVEKPEYWIIEANERPGLANHEPAPTAQKFIDLLFPQTIRPHARTEPADEFVDDPTEHGT